MVQLGEKHWSEELPVVRIWRVDVGHVRFGNYEEKFGPVTADGSNGLRSNHANTKAPGFVSGVSCDYQRHPDVSRGTLCWRTNVWSLGDASRVGGGKWTHSTGLQCLKELDGGRTGASSSGSWSAALPTLSGS